MDIVVKSFDELTTVELYEILKARAAIFVVEQNCVYQNLDDVDHQSLHVFYQEDNRVLAYLRAFYKEKGVVQIGRVLTMQRGNGWGGKLLHEGLIQIQKRIPAQKIYIEAQKYVIGYYQREGFQVTSEPFLEDGIEHVQMKFTIKKDRNENSGPIFLIDHKEWSQWLDLMFPLRFVIFLNSFPFLTHCLFQVFL